MLTSWAADGSLGAAAREALRLDGEPAQLTALISQWAAGDFSGLPPIEVVEGSVLPGAAGAYAISTGTIYLNRDWLASAGEDRVLAVLTEELGHHLDGLLNVSDTPGDEGEIIAGLVRQEEFSPARLFMLRTENDCGTAILNGRTVAFEQATASIRLVASYPGLRYANDVRIAGNYAYIADFLSPTADLIILSISPAAKPAIVGQSNAMGNLTDVDIVNGILYATDGRSGLRIIDVYSPSSPTIKSTYNSPGDANDVKIVGSLAYLPDGISGLQIVNISNTNLPVLQATADSAIGVTGSISAVDVAGNLAVVASKGVGTGRLQTINVSDPKAPRKMGETLSRLRGRPQQYRSWAAPHISPLAIGD